MNNGNAAAKRRRANIQPEPPRAISQPNQSSFSSQQSINPPAGLTLQQVVSLTDVRLTNLEAFMREIQNKEPSFKETPENSKNIIENMDEMFDDVNRKFDILAEEITNLKDVVMKLQTYTMEVNRILLEKTNMITDECFSMEQDILNDTTCNSKKIVFQQNDEAENNQEKNAEPVPPPPQPVDVPMNAM